jgi:uncharacterized protein
VSLLARFAAMAALAVATHAWGVTASDALLNRLQPRRDGAGIQFVNDFSETLTAAQQAGLEQRVRAMEQTCGAQLSVVIIQSLEGGDIDDFANKLFKRWSVGQKEKNNGVMLLVALQDRKMRIEVGYGLEPILPDVLAARIIDEQLRPQFRQGHYAEGLRLGVERIATIIERDEPPSQSETSPVKASRSSPPPIGLQLLLTTFFALFVALGMFAVGQGVGSMRFFPVVWGLGFGGIPIAMALTVGGFVPYAQIPVAVVMIALGFRNGRKNPTMFQPSVRRYSPGGFGTTGGWSGGGFGGFDGGGFGGGGFGGGGFGGGCSGGGGASGGW